MLIRVIFEYPEYADDGEEANVDTVNVVIDRDELAAKVAEVVRECGIPKSIRIET